MLSYLHGYHAGNAADVFKHSVLIFCLDYLKRKEKPLLCVDTHAGAGFYDTAAMPNSEWEKGKGRLSGLTDPPPMVLRYLEMSGTEIENQEQPGFTKQPYYGSPLIMAKILEKGDRLVCFELHPREYEALGLAIAGLGGGYRRGQPSIEVRREDGPGGLKSLLPPPSRRGLVFIDPSWEELSDNEIIPRAVTEGLKRFPEGTFIIWYPLLAIPKKKFSVPLRDLLFDVPAEKRCRAELYVKAPEEQPEITGASQEEGSSPRGMYGSGLVIINPPWTLRAAAEETLPYLAKVLGGDEGGWRLEWKE